MKKTIAYSGRFSLALALSLFMSGLWSPLNAQIAPSTYNAYSGTDAKPAPAPPALGPANSVIKDPTFGSRILRVTDGNTKSGQSFISTDAGFFRSWNANSTAIKLTGPTGDGYWLEFNPTTFKAGDGSARPVPHAVPFGATWEWSAVDPDIIYYLTGNRIAKYNKATGASTNLAGTPNGDPLGGMAVVVGLDNWVCSPAGPGVQDSRYKFFCVNPSSPTVSKFVDVLAKTVNGTPQGDPNWPLSGAGKTIGIHAISGGTGANYIDVTFHGQNWGANGGAIFNMATNTWSVISNQDPYWAGHLSLGNGKYANASGSVDTRDSRGMVLRNPDNAMNKNDYKFVYQPPAPSNGWCDADHSSWHNSATNPNAPILVSRYGGSNCYQHAWTGEIDAAAVDGSNKVWRFAHNHNTGGSCYYGQAFAQISKDGKWALFSSPWGGTLGSGSGFGCGVRIDTFVVELIPGGGGEAPGGEDPEPIPTPIPQPPLPGGGESTTTRVEQNGAGVTYTGSWGTDTKSYHSGGSAASSMETGSAATLSFTGTGVKLIGYKDQWSGIANIFVDGVQKATVDLYASPDQKQATLYEISGLPQAAHTLQVKVSGIKNSASAGRWIWVDAFDVTSGGTSGNPPTPTPEPTPPTPTPGVTRVEQNGAGVTYAGSWGTDAKSYHSGGSAASSMETGSTATVQFTGTGIRFIGYKDQWSGIANVFVNGVLKASVDLYSSSDQRQALLYEVSGLNQAAHTLQVKVTGTKNASSAGRWIWVDAFDITSGTEAAPTPPTPTPPTPTPGTKITRTEQNGAGVTYAGSWGTDSKSYHSGGSAANSMETGATATITFTGIGVSWIGYKDQWSGIANVYIDGALKSAIDLYSASDQRQATLYTISGLSNAAHTLQIKVSGTRNAASAGRWIWIDAFDITTKVMMSITGSTMISDGDSPLLVASAEVSGGRSPAGLALISLRQNNTLVTEAGVPASAAVLRGRVDAEISSTVKTGFALANPNDSVATVSFFFTDPDGVDSGWGSLTLPPHGQLARFLDQSPYNSPNAAGTLSFSSDVPVSGIALRGLVNERSEFLVTTLPIANPDESNRATISFPHMADGGGWTTQFALVNPTEGAISGRVTYADQSGTPGESFDYNIPARSSRRFQTRGSEAEVRVGSAQVVPNGSDAAPVGIAIFSYKKDGITVSEAGVPSLPAGKGFQLFVESSQDGLIRSGIAVRNASSSAASVKFGLYGMDGSYTGLSGSVDLPVAGQRAFFLDELEGFKSLPRPFQGFVRIGSSEAEIAVVGLRGRTNERGDFLVTTTPPVNDETPLVEKLVFPHVVHGEGYTTQFVVYGAGAVDVRNQSGAALQMNWQ